MLMEQGLSVVHLFGKSTPNLDREAIIAAVKEALHQLEIGNLLLGSG